MRLNHLPPKYKKIILVVNLGNLCWVVNTLVIHPKGRRFKSWSGQMYRMTHQFWLKIPSLLKNGYSISLKQNKHHLIETAKLIREHTRIGIQGSTVQISALHIFPSQLLIAAW
jgi:hypothetical protein